MITMNPFYFPFQSLTSFQCILKHIFSSHPLITPTQHIITFPYHRLKPFIKALILACHLPEPNSKNSIWNYSKKHWARWNRCCQNIHPFHTSFISTTPEHSALSHPILPISPAYFPYFPFPYFPLSPLLFHALPAMTKPGIPEPFAV